MGRRAHFSRNSQGCQGLRAARPGWPCCQLLHGMMIPISAGSHGKLVSVFSPIIATWACSRLAMRTAVQADAKGKR